MIPLSIILVILAIIFSSKSVSGTNSQEAADQTVNENPVKAQAFFAVQTESNRKVSKSAVNNINSENLKSSDAKTREQEVLKIGDFGDEAYLETLEQMKANESNQNTLYAINLVLMRLNNLKNGATPYSVDAKALSTDGKTIKTQIDLTSIQKEGTLQITIGNPDMSKDENNYIVTTTNNESRKSYVGYVKINGEGKYTVDYGVILKSNGKPYTKYFKKTFTVKLINGKYHVS